MPTRLQQENLAIRGAYIAAHHHFGLTWIEISSIFGVLPNTASQAYARARSRANSDNLCDILRQAIDHSSPGREQHFPEGSEVSKAFAELSQKDRVHQDAPHRLITAEISRQFNTKISRQTGENILQDHHYIHKRLARVKPRLSAENKLSRVAMAQRLLPRIEAGDLFIFTDETSIDSLYHSKHPRVSRPTGSNPEDYKREKHYTTEAFMFWGAIAPGYGVGPCHVWQKETEAEKLAIKRDIDKINQHQENRESAKRQRAIQPSTAEYAVLTEVNTNIARERSTRGNNRLQFKRPEQLFKEPRATRGSTKGGIDWIRYKRTILESLLWPFAQRIARETSKRVWIIEDNAPGHKKARLFTKHQAKQQGIHAVDWSPNSPDLNQIEPLWAYLKDMLEKWALEQGFDRVTRTQLIQQFKQEWYQVPLDLVEDLCNSFKYKLELCLKHNGDNNWHG